MTDIRLTNSMTRAKEPFAPLDPSNVRMYVCGPTVYDRAHLGNARPVIVFDVLYRLLRHVYGAEHVTYVRNITDIDDKIIARADETGRPIDDITAETTRWYAEDMASLGALPPTHEPRATGHIPHMVSLIEELVAKGHAYEAEGHVLFSVASDADYGALSGRSTDDMIAGARVEVAPYKRDPMDFVLWKPSTDDQPGWDGPAVGNKKLGRGRPGWHIECSAMARDLLGPAFDIHGGGSDLMFPHHENEIAQSRSAGDGFAQVWLHNEMLQVEGRKMSKSLGNFFTVRDLLDGKTGRPWPREVIRFVYLQTHYRSPMDWTEKKSKEAEMTLKEWRRMTAGVQPGEISPAVIAALADDLNTHAAVTVLHRLADGGDAEGLVASARLLGILTEELADWPWQQHVITASGSVTIPMQRVSATGTFAPLMSAEARATKLIHPLLRERAEARKARDFETADRIRTRLEGAGVVVEDTPEGTNYSIDLGYVASHLKSESGETAFSGVAIEDINSWVASKLEAGR